MSSSDRTPPALDGANSVFASRSLPDLVFQPAIQSCAWICFDNLCCTDGWSLLRELARAHGDASVHIIALDVDEPTPLNLLADLDEDAYHTLCDDELVSSNLVRWWGSSGRWGIHGSRGLELAVAGQVARLPWPHPPDCHVLSIDAALRLWRGLDEDRERLLATYDALSWDPALGDHEAIPQLLDLCSEVALDHVDPVVAIRALVDLLERAPKAVRRIPATSQLHHAWTRTSYLMLDAADRLPWGELLLAKNDSNHERHSAEERAFVRQACEEIVAAAERA